LAKRRRIRWQALQSHPLIFAGEVSGNRSLLDGALKASGVTLHSFYEVQRSSTALGLVAEGLGAAVVPRLAIQKNAYPMIRTVELVEPEVSRALVLVTRKSAQLSPAARALYDRIVGGQRRRPDAGAEGACRPAPRSCNRSHSRTRAVGAAGVARIAAPCQHIVCTGLPIRALRIRIEAIVLPRQIAIGVGLAIRTLRERVRLIDGALRIRIELGLRGGSRLRDEQCGRSGKRGEQGQSNAAGMHGELLVQ